MSDFFEHDTERHPFATESELTAGTHRVDSIGKILHDGDAMTCMCCGSDSVVTERHDKGEDGFAFGGSQWVRTPRWLLVLRTRLATAERELAEMHLSALEWTRRATNAEEALREARKETDRLRRLCGEAARYVEDGAENPLASKPLAERLQLASVTPPATEVDGG